MAALALAFLASLRFGGSFSPRPRVGWVLSRRRGPRLFAANEEELERMRAEIAELEADLSEGKREAAPAAAAAAEPRKRVGGGAAIVDGKVRVASVLAKLDESLLPDGAAAESEKGRFGEFLLLERMTGEGLKHVEIGGLRAVSVDGSEELLLLLSGLEDVNPGDGIDVGEIKRETDKFVETLSKYAAENEGGSDEDVWEKVNAEWDAEDDEGDADAAAAAVVEEFLGSDGDGDGDVVFGIDLSDAATLTPQVLGYRVGERFGASVGDHWQDWCEVAAEREGRRRPLAAGEGEAEGAASSFLTPEESALYGAALERLKGRIALDAVSSAAFAAEVGASATSNDESFAQNVGLFEVAFRVVLRRVAAKAPGERTVRDLEDLWTALKVSTLRTARRVELVKDIAGYFFETVTASPAADLVLDKLKGFKLVPDDETDPVKLRDAFVDRASAFFQGAVVLFNVLGAVLSFAVAYALFAFVLEPVFGALFGGVQSAINPADSIPDFFSQR